MSGYDVPVLTVTTPGNHKEFLKKNKEDILATIEFLYKRGMWSKFHYEQWKKNSCGDGEMKSWACKELTKFDESNWVLYTDKELTEVEISFIPF